MRNLKMKFWRAVAQRLIQFTTVNGAEQRAWYPLFQLAQQNPYFHLEGYMMRYWVIRHPARKGEPGYGTFRNFLRYLYPFYARFHLILRADDERHPHNHPFPFVSMIQKGWYEEEVTTPDGKVTKHRYNAGDVNFKYDHHLYHRITAISPEGVLTLVIMGRRDIKSWGFLVDNQHILWSKYLDIFQVGQNHE